MSRQIPSVRAFDPRYDMYELQQDIPGAGKGAIFFHDPGASIFGEPHCSGALILCWTEAGNCFKGSHCAGAVIINGTTAEDTRWWRKVSKSYSRDSIKDILAGLISTTESMLAQMKGLLKIDGCKAQNF